MFRFTLSCFIVETLTKIYMFFWNNNFCDSIGLNLPIMIFIFKQESTIPNSKQIQWMHGYRPLQLQVDGHHWELKTVLWTKSSGEWLCVLTHRLPQSSAAFQSCSAHHISSDVCHTGSPSSWDKKTKLQLMIEKSLYAIILALHVFL